MTPGSELPYKVPTDMFKTLDLAQFEANLRQMDAILTDIETGKGLVGQFVAGHGPVYRYPGSGSPTSSAVSARPRAPPPNSGRICTPTVYTSGSLPL